MIRILMGEMGTGKTKAFIEMVNQSVNEEKGNVVCIMKGDSQLFVLQTQQIFMLKTTTHFTASSAV